MRQIKKVKPDISDDQLIPFILDGNNEAVTTLINRHKDFIYNLSFKMVGNIEDAEDLTQEIWIKVITRLSSYNNESQFKTWLYRVAVNHILNFRKSTREMVFSSFEKHDILMKQLERDEKVSDTLCDNNLLLQETKVECMTGILLCLSREQRIVFILGSIFEISSKIGGEILDITPENFRKGLSRARQQLTNYMHGRCSLITPGGTCSCKRKTHAAIRAGLIDPVNLKYSRKSLKRIHEIASEKTERIIENISEMKCQQEFQEHPYLILENNVLKSVFDAFN